MHPAPLVSPALTELSHSPRASCRAAGSWFTFWLTPASSFVPRQLISLFGAIIFSLFIIYDTNNIMKHFGVDDYIIAVIELYLDVINLFRYLLMFLSMSGGRD